MTNIFSSLPAISKSNWYWYALGGLGVILGFEYFKNKL